MNEAVIVIICFILLAVGISLLKSAVKAQTAKDTPFVLINAKNPEMGLILDAINKDFSGIHIINGFR